MASITGDSSNIFINNGDLRLTGSSSSIHACEFKTVSSNIVISQTTEGMNKIAIGYNAGLEAGEDSIAIGRDTAFNDQGVSAISVGFQAGHDTQGDYSIALGSGAGADFQGISSIAIGRCAGENSQGSNCIAIGAYAGQTDQHSGTIVMNASGVPLDTKQSNSLYIDSIRNITNVPRNFLCYDSSNCEVYYTNTEWVDISNTIQLSNLTIGTGTIEASYMRYDQTMTGYMIITLGTGFTLGAHPSFYIPYPMTHPRQANSWTGGVYDASTGNEYVISGYGMSTTQIEFRHHQINTNDKNVSKIPITSSDPIEFAPGDIISIFGSYKVANGY